MSSELVFYGNETLKAIADEVMNIDESIIRLIDEMHTVMYRAKGIGLAAPQVEKSKRLIIMDLESYEGPAKSIINPVIKDSSDVREEFEEGCLSIPGILKKIIRPVSVLIAGLSPEGREIEFEADGLLARVLQHEIDHLNGVLFIDYLEDYQKKELRPDLKKIKKLNTKL